jgi:hypothetical protein
MSGKFLIELTDARFKIPANAEVIDFITRVNPFAHSDVADRLIESSNGLPGSEEYCPAPANCAYVILHDPGNRVFAIAYDQRGLAFRLPPERVPDALSDRGARQPDIGTDWVRFEPWRLGEPSTTTLDRLKRWCAIAARQPLPGND